MPDQAEDRAYADRILRNSMQVRQQQTVREKVVRIARYLLSRTTQYIFIVGLAVWLFAAGMLTLRSKVFQIRLRRQR